MICAYERFVSRPTNRLRSPSERKDVELNSATLATTEDVITAAKAGAEDAWAAIFEQHYVRVYRFMRSRMGDAEEAEDLTANTFLEAFRSIGKFNWQGKPFEAWLFGIAHHQIASYYRKRSGKLPHMDETARDEFIDVEIRDILDSLPAVYREALELRFIVGLSGIEAATVMGRTHGAFRSLLHRAAQAYRDRAADDRERPRPEPRRSFVAGALGFAEAPAVGRSDDPAALTS